MDEERVIASAWLPEPLGRRFEDYRWKKRMNKTDVVIAAIAEYLDRHDVHSTSGPAAGILVEQVQP